MVNKRVLYIGTPIFNYYKKISTEFEKQGFIVDYYNDRPNENAFTKGIIKINRNIIGTLIQKYFDKIIIDTNDKKYDLVFFVNCKSFNAEMVAKLKNRQKDAKFVLYMWDSLALYPDCKEVIPIFDKAYSFDLDDCIQNSQLTFMPLFYCKEFEEIGKNYMNSKHEYDIISVCTAHPNRYKIIKKLFPELESKGIRVYSYMFINKLQYWYNKIFIEEFKKAKSKEFKFQPLSEEENFKKLNISNSVFDIRHNKQSGLTLRTIETLGANKKLITNNSDIVKYDFYNKNNILIVDHDNWHEIEMFLKNEYIPITGEIYNKYSLHNWVASIILQEDNKYLL